MGGQLLQEIMKQDRGIRDWGRKPRSLVPIKGGKNEKEFNVDFGFGVCCQHGPAVRAELYRRAEN
jgi:hypothetical protein